jgi:DNA-binding transcriptional ArsR family regulator
MVEDPPQLDAVFHALAHGARRDMVRRMASGEFTIGQLAEPLDMSFAGASKHVQVLERAGVVDRTVVGREHRCRLRAAGLRPAGDWIAECERYWSARLDALEALMDVREEQR